jgi:Leucine rich repeat/Leucine Rich repeat
MEFVKDRVYLPIAIDRNPAGVPDKDYWPEGRPTHRDVISSLRSRASPEVRECPMDRTAHRRPEEPPAFRRFGVRRSLIIGVVLSVLAAPAVRLSILAHRQRTAVRAIERADAHVAYRTDLQHGQPISIPERWARAWVVHSLGRDYFEDVVYVDLVDRASDDALSAVGQLAGTQELYLSNSSVTDVGLGHIRGLSQLRRLDLSNTRVTDHGMVHLRRLTRLEELHLDGTAVSNCGLSQLADLVQLRILGLSNTDVTDEGLAPLKGFLRLEELDLRGTTVRELGAQELRRAHRTAKILFTPTILLQSATFRWKPGIRHAQGGGGASSSLN